MDLVFYPDPRLKKKSTPVEKFDQDLHDLTRSMLDFMYKSKGVGLAGPQIGINQNLFVMNPTGEANQEDMERVVINPEILSHEGAVYGEEGCLSLPALFAEVTRPEKIEVEYQNVAGEKATRTLDGFEARVFLHEIDHLEGILFINRMEPAEKILLGKKLKKLEAQYTRNRASN